MIASTLAACGGLAFAGKEVLVGQSVAEDERVPLTEISHTAWDELLRDFVDEKGFVDYKRWHQSRDALAKLDDYIDHLSTAEVKTSRSKSMRLAFWINAYNAVTIKGILREYPTSSIRNHTARLWGYNIWKDLKLRVDGVKVSVEAMEHEYLRKMGEPRIHFAIVCASVSCPKLRNEAYEPERVYEQLDASARDFFANSSKFSFDAASGTVGLSQIFGWFPRDFGADQEERLKYIAKFAPKAARPVLMREDTRVYYLKYDWGLNEKK